MAEPLKRGDAKAADRLFGAYGKRLYGFALGYYLKSKEEAEKVVQELFYKNCKIYVADEERPLQPYG